MGTLVFIDSAWPVPSTQYPGGVNGVAGYIGGDTPHVWSLAEWDGQPAQYRLPIYTRSNPQQANPVNDANAAIAMLKVIGAPEGTLVAWDMEMAEDSSYIASVYNTLHAAGYMLIVYGSQSFVTGNHNPDGLYWGAEWSGVPHIAVGDVVTQFVSFQAFDESLAEATLPFWDAHPSPTPGPKPYPAPAGVKAGNVALEVSWDEEVVAGQPVGSYTVQAVGLDGKTYARTTTTHTSAVLSGLVPRWTYDIRVWANGGPVAPPHTTIRVTV